MNSPFANLFLAIQARIVSVMGNEIRYIDHDLGQLENYNPQNGGKPRVSWPCALIDFENFDFEEEGEFTERGEGIVLIRLGFDTASPTDQLTPLAARQSGNSFLDTEWRLHKALKGWAATDACGYLSRVSAKTEKREDFYRVRQIRYSLSISDMSTLLPLNTVNKSLVPLSINP